MGSKRRRKKPRKPPWQKGRWSSSVIHTRAPRPGTNYQSLADFNGKFNVEAEKKSLGFHATLMTSERRKAALKKRDELLGETPSEMRVLVLEGNIIKVWLYFQSGKDHWFFMEENHRTLTMRKSRVYRYKWLALERFENNEVVWDKPVQL